MVVGGTLKGGGAGSASVRGFPPEFKPCNQVKEQYVDVTSVLHVQVGEPETAKELPSESEEISIWRPLDSCVCVMTVF